MGALRYRLLAGAAAIALTSLAGAAQAQQVPAATAPTPSGADGLSPDSVYIEADSASRTGDLVTAEAPGADRVLARFRGATLRAGAVSYDLGLGIAIDMEKTPNSGAVSRKNTAKTPDKPTALLKTMLLRGAETFKSLA